MQTRAILSALVAAVVLALAVGSASANELAYSEDQYDIRWAALEFTPTAGSIMRCPLTLLGSFHTRTIDKAEGALIGDIDHAVLRGGSGAGECTGGTATILNASLPWHVTYESFTGELPDIDSYRIILVGASFEIINSLGINCLARTTLANPAAGEVTVSESGQVTTLTGDPDVSIPVTGGDSLCAFVGVEASFSGSGSFEDRRGGLLFIDLV